MMGHRISLILLLITTSRVCTEMPSQKDTISPKCKLEDLEDSGPAPFVKRYIAICSALGLTRVPDNLPNSTVELYLDQNAITVVESFAFSYMPRLRVLDLGLSNVGTLSINCFAGLTQLEELYLPINNIFSPSQIAPHVFAPLSQLRVLHVQGMGNDRWYSNNSYSTWSKEIERLNSLEELAMSYYSDLVFPSELARLPNLTNLHLSFGKSYNITSESLKTLRGGKIRELSFKANKNLFYIEHGSFDDMPELRLLNFACCYNLNLDNIIDVLSNVSNTQVTHLIVDNTNHGKRGADIYGKKDVLECRSAWHHVTHLSLQEWGVRLIYPAALRCLQNLTALSYGYAQMPSPYPYPTAIEVLYSVLERFLPKSALQSVRFSYALRDALPRYRMDWGCFSPYRRRPNTDYFPPMPVSKASSSILHHDPNATEEITTEEEDEHEAQQTESRRCQIISFFPTNLKYFALDNFGVAAAQSYFCYRFTPNKLRFLNLSSNPAFAPDRNGVLFGLDQLRVVDVSRSRYRKLSPLLLEHFPSLTHIYASENALEQDSFSSIGKARKLQHIDISDNAITRLDRGIFSGLAELRSINLAKNLLNSTYFLIDVIPFIQSIDISGNQMRYLSEMLRDAIDARCDNTDADCALEINLLDNPLSCECENFPFIKWIKATRADITKKEILKCFTHNGQIEAINSIDVSSMGRYCAVMAHLPLIASISATVAMVVLVAAPLAYRFRWHLKWYLYRLKYLRKRNRYTARAERHLRDSCVIYALENGDDRRWVIETLRIKLEQENNYSLWLEGRNDIPGRFRVDNLMDMLRRSRTAIWILSQTFLQDIMCLEMAHQAFIRLGHKKNLVVRRPEVAEGINEELARRDIGQILEVLHPTYGIRVAEYAPENIHSETLFWETITSFLDRNAVHEADSEMTPLLHGEQEQEGALYE